MMDYLYFFALFILFVQGISTLLNKNLKDHVREFGALTMIFSVILLVIYLKFVTGPLVLSREFGYLIAEDLGGKYWLLALIFTFCVLFSFAWRISREFAGQVVTIPKFLLAGIIVGLASVLFVRQVESTFADELPLYAYDLWWPPLLIWSAACFVGSVISLLGWSSFAEIKGYKIDMAQPGCIAAITTLLSFSALAERFGGPAATLLMWKLVVLVSSPIALILAAHLSWDSSKLWRRRLVFYLSCIFGIALAINAVENPSNFYLNSLSWLLVLSLALLPLLKKKVKAIPAYLTQLDDSRDDTLKFAYKLLTASLIVSVAFSLAALFLNLGRIDTSVLVTLGIISWVVLIDVIWKNGLITSTLSVLSKGYQDPIQVLVLPQTIYNIVVTDILKPVLNVLGKFFIAEKWYGTLFKSLLSILVLVALSEIPNAGRTILMPVDVSSAIGDSEVGDQITDRTVYELKRLSQQLTQEVALVNPQTTNWELYGRESGVTQEAVVESGSVELPGGVKLPLHLLLWPVQKPMRWLLDVNVIQGSLVKVEDGYGLIANSSHGDGWYIEVPLTKTVNSLPGTPTRQVEQDHAESAEANQAQQADTKNGLAKVIPQIARRLAFHIVANEESAALAGIPTKWDAYQEYARGLEALNSYLLYDTDGYRYEKLDRAIEHFQEAINRDPSSESAYYRFGLALQEDLQSYRALEAYETSLDLNPTFSPARVALAYLKTYPPSFNLSLPPGINTTGGRRSDIGRLWGKIIKNAESSRENLASAYSVVANLELDIIQQGAENPEKALAAYYFAYQAINNYADLSTENTQAIEVAQFESLALNVMGVILDKVQTKVVTVPNTLYWTCSYGELTEPLANWNAGPYLKDAYKYYQRAIDKYADDSVIQCNHAETAIRLGDEEPMRRLSNLAAARRWAGDLIQPTDINNLASKLSEYRQAINLDSSDNLARNAFAYAFYLYRRDHELPDDPKWRLLDWGLEAEAHARSAERLARVANDPNLIIYKSTLGQVLLAMHRFEEAKAVFESITIPNHPTFYEVKWDLAQTYACLGKVQNSEFYRAKAQQQLTGIRTIDLQRDVPLYKDDHSILDIEFARHFCEDGVENSLLSDDGLSLEYTIAEPVYDQFIPCDRNVVELLAEDTDNFLIRIWGAGGVNRVIEPNKKRNYSVLSWEVKDSQGEFFTRLYWNYGNPSDPASHDYRPVSSVISLRTYADCKKNRTKIHFVANTMGPDVD